VGLGEGFLKILCLRHRLGVAGLVGTLGSPATPSFITFFFVVVPIMAGGVGEMLPLRRMLEISANRKATCSPSFCHP
jgi:Na+/citrate or Na+/malate symporter